MVSRQALANGCWDYFPVKDCNPEGHHQPCPLRWALWKLSD